MDFRPKSDVKTHFVDIRNGRMLMRVYDTDFYARNESAIHAVLHALTEKLRTIFDGQSMQRIDIVLSNGSTVRCSVETDSAIGQSSYVSIMNENVETVLLNCIREAIDNLTAQNNNRILSVMA